MVALLERGFAPSRRGRQRKLPWWLIAPRAGSGRILDWLSRSSADSGKTTAERLQRVLEQRSIRRHCLWLASHCDCGNVTLAAHSGSEPLTCLVRCDS
jgi:hypothetical protein